MSEKKYIQSFQLSVIISSIIILVALIIIGLLSGPAQGWIRHQKNYSGELETVLKDSSEEAVTAFDRGLQELQLAGLNRTDRCVTCHTGMLYQNVVLANSMFSSHPGSYLFDHPVEDYGCTVCHGGDGRSVSETEAHGVDPSTQWSRPLLLQPYLQASCGNCHLAVFSNESQLKGTEVFTEGKGIFEREGCLGCHKARGVGGMVGPDLTEQGEKTRQEYNFQNITEEQTVSNWLKEHFRDPEMVSPGSRMLKIDLPEEELDALTTFVLGLAKPDIDFSYFSLAALAEFKGDRTTLPADRSFSMVCSGCHGKEGEGKDYEEYETGVPGIFKRDFNRVVSPEYIKFTLDKGRSNREMASWDPIFSGLRDEELNAVVKMIMEPGTSLEFTDGRNNGDKAIGGQLFARYCATCHGQEGAGGLAVALNRPDLLRNADDSYLFSTLAKGRRNAGMPGWSFLGKDSISHLLSHLRSWQRFNPAVSASQITGSDPVQGRLDYLFMCSRCHGEAGQGETGPAIINKDFLTAATNTYLAATIAFGRDHTAMFGWSTDVYNEEQLDMKQIGNIIAFLRETSALVPNYIYAGSNPGDDTRGEQLFQQHCSKCHGKNGEGERAPALNNQELLSAATNGYLVATITLGRNGTKMPAWGYETADHPVLTPSERLDIVAWIRGWQRIKIRL